MRKALPFPYHPGLWRALALSIALHAALLASGLRLPAPFVPPVSPTLHVRLAEAPPVPAPQPVLRLPEDTPPAPPVAAQSPPAPPPVAKRLVRPAQAAPRTAPGGVRELSGEAARVARAQVARELLYPLEAIDRGLEGEVLVMLFLDEAGNAIAARVEASSGHAILDEAAVRAARALRALPSSAPREALLPVRFRLR